MPRPSLPAASPAWSCRRHDRHYLRREPNVSPDFNFDGYSFWLGKLDEFNGNYIQAEMVKAFINAPEYRQRFGQ